MILRPFQESATKYEREGNLTWQDEFDGLELDEWAAEEAGEGILGLEYWWQHEEVSIPPHFMRLRGVNIHFLK